MRLHRDRHLGAGGEQRNLGGPVRGDDFVGAGGAAVRLVMGKPQLRQVLPGERENARRLRIFERELPAFDSLDRVAGTENVEVRDGAQGGEVLDRLVGRAVFADRKSTRLNSSHLGISYAVFCLKKKNK